MGGGGAVTEAPPFRLLDGAWTAQECPGDPVVKGFTGDDGQKSCWRRAQGRCDDAGVWRAQGTGPQRKQSWLATSRPVTKNQAVRDPENRDGDTRMGASEDRLGSHLRRWTPSQVGASPPGPWRMPSRPLPHWAMPVPASVSPSCHLAARR